jgi:energy-converting hydrogenase Eha subunit G
MYDLLTSSILFLVLVPGVLVTIPPGGGVVAAVVHAVVFYVVQRYVAQYVPWWGVWVLAAIAVALKLFGGASSAPTSTFSGGRR